LDNAEEVGLKWDEVTKGWRKLHIDELSSFVFPKYEEGDEIKEDKMGGTCRTYGERKNVYGGFSEKPEGTKPLGKKKG
jgi:hypothetical protein